MQGQTLWPTKGRDTPLEDTEPSRTSDPYHRPGFGGHKGHVATEALASITITLILDAAPNKKEQMRSLRLGSFSFGGWREGIVWPYTPRPRTRARGCQQLPPKAQPHTPTQQQQETQWRRVDLAKPQPSPEGVGPSLPLQGAKVTSKGNIQQAPLIWKKLNIP